MKKYIAKQIDPEIQTSPMFYTGSIDMESWPDISLFGNRQYKGYMTPVFEEIMRSIDEAHSELIDTDADPETAWYHNEREVVEDYFPSGKPYTDKQIEEIADLVRDWGYDLRTYDEHRILSLLVESITGKPHDISRLTGCCQGDVIYACYPSDEYDRHSIDCLESEYFNLGTEWQISFEPVEINDPNDPAEMLDYCKHADLVCHYCYGSSTEEMRKEIAEAMDIPADELILLEHDGYMHISKYKIG